MKKVLVLYYSRHGSTKNLAYKIAQGIESQGCEALLRTVPPVSNNLDSPSDSLPSEGDPYVSQQEVRDCDGLIYGSPVRFGNMSAAMKYFWDGTSEQWLNGQLSGKPASVFTTSSSLHGGQESTLLTMMLPLFHHGMLVMGLPYSEPELNRTQTGGTPYGVTHVAGLNNQTQLSQDESALCVAQGKRLAQLVIKLG